MFRARPFPRTSTPRDRPGAGSCSGMLGEHRARWCVPASSQFHRTLRHRVIDTKRRGRGLSGRECGRRRFTGRSSPWRGELRRAVLASVAVTCDRCLVSCWVAGCMNGLGEQTLDQRVTSHLSHGRFIMRSGNHISFSITAPSAQEGQSAVAHRSASRRAPTRSSGASLGICMCVDEQEKFQLGSRGSRQRQTAIATLPGSSSSKSRREGRATFFRHAARG